LTRSIFGKKFTLAALTVPEKTPKYYFFGLMPFSYFGRYLAYGFSTQNVGINAIGCFGSPERALSFETSPSSNGPSLPAILSK
jgi:hypothetical protein